MTQYTFPADIGEIIDAMEIIEAAWPVGTIVLTENNTNPEDLGLPGTWEEI